MFYLATHAPVAIPNRVAAVNASVSGEGPYINAAQPDIDPQPHCPFPEQDSQLDASLLTLLPVLSSHYIPIFFYILSVALLAWR